MDVDLYPRFFAGEQTTRNQYRIVFGARYRRPSTVIRIRDGPKKGMYFSGDTLGTSPGFQVYVDDACIFPVFTHHK